jgi:hypothetical protein
VVNNKGAGTRNLIQSVRDEIRAVRDDLKNEIGAVRNELKNELRDEIGFAAHFQLYNTNSKSKCFII